MTLVGIDTGGTFTDFVCLDDEGRLVTHKVLSTPQAPEQAILQGITDLGLAGTTDLYIVHGSTVATNAALEHKGVRTVFITNHGLGDMLTLGRQTRAALYDLQPSSAPPPVPPELCLETGGRLGADGRVVESLTQADLSRLTDEVRALAPEAVAINLLFSFLDDRFEREIEQCLPSNLFISRSSSVLPEYREYERGIATWLNAWLGPIVEGYLARMSRGLTTARISVMQSSGDTIAASQAGGQAVRMLLSGPAGGLAGVRFTGQAAGRDRLLSFDMGGTSTDVALIDGEALLTTEGRIGPWPVAVPMVDMHTIGAGGGSIARIDGGGMLRVGPESAGADPGPACYGRGGNRATVTDANLVLGRLLPDAFLGGRMRLDADAGRRAIETVAAELGISTEQAADGIVRIANEHMTQALHVISTERGLDPRSCTLACFGGAGGLHVCALAESLGMKQAMVPMHAGILSALGMLAAPRGRQLSRSLTRPLESIDNGEIELELEALAARGREELARENVAAEEVVVTSTVDLRYQGQSHAMNLAWQRDRAALITAFHDLHAERYGHRLKQPIELVNLRVGLRGPMPLLRLTPPMITAPGDTRTRTRVHGITSPVPVFGRDGIAPEMIIDGPALVTETVSTTWIAPDWRCRVDAIGNLLLEHQ